MALANAVCINLINDTEVARAIGKSNKHDFSLGNDETHSSLILDILIHHKGMEGNGELV